jgi:hypothetical protein
VAGATLEDTQLEKLKAKDELVAQLAALGI